MTRQAAAPFAKFNDWFSQATRELGAEQASAVNLATVSGEGKPSSRMVLLKEHDERGFVFYTNLKSRKATELTENAAVAMCFHWSDLGKQVRIEGHAMSVSDVEADRYFATRPLASRYGAWASQQSSQLKNRRELAGRLTSVVARFKSRDVPRPPFWSGFRVRAERIEFWSNARFRLHDRICYQRTCDGAWQQFLLYP
ncbi:hypothetical protein EH31_10950 [Erythrobacter longus]|uniref:Pyridoxine/pyridoxamine 5'-phosphate oxidase n=1 Tax=Erythrobacter longus TaxID=1044 RepID=A0A074MVQ6_ERYLO|nr:pyridoxamine 5'-phosphate oxidase [Erythrobacter longus]KEO89667.1 hypothetical protein EH31_10950 [Erythrobacter longus]